MPPKQGALLVIGMTSICLMEHADAPNVYALPTEDIGNGSNHP
jgi:hypothetical protein